MHLEVDWELVWYENAIPHAVPNFYKQFVTSDLESRGAKYYKADPIKKFVLDRGGMCRADRSHHDFDVDGLVISIPSEDVPFFYQNIKILTQRLYNDMFTYYKIKTWPGFALVLSDSQRDLLLSLIEKVLDECEEIVENESKLWRNAFKDGLDKHVLSERRNPKKEKGAN